jgi:SAM-dependent methyltransferase
LAFAPEQAALNRGFPPGEFDRLAASEAGHFWFQARNSLLLWALSKFAPDMRRFLEIGCGTGFVLSAVERSFPDAEVTGCEIYSEGLAQASRRLTRARLYQMDATALPFRDEFDVIGMFDVLEHIEDDALVLRAVRDAMTAKGLLILTVPQHPWLWSYVDEYSCHVRRYTAPGMRALLGMSGFKVLGMTSFVSLLLPLMALSRARKGQDPERFDPSDEFRINPTLNRILGLTMDVERWIIKAGVALPIGGSLLVYACRDDAPARH